MNIFQKAKWLLFLNKLANDKTMIEKLKSRKLWATVGGVALTALLSQLGVDPAWTDKIVQLILGYVLTEGIVDTARVIKVKSLVNPAA